MKLVPSTEQDIDILSRWIEFDKYHDNVDPHWWLTGADGSLLSFCVQDEIGCVAYVRLDEKQDSLIRLHTQFGPREEVSKIRLVESMDKCIPMIRQFCEQHDAGVIFQSTSPSLIHFMEMKFQFKPAGGNDYVLPLQVSA